MTAQFDDQGDRLDRLIRGMRSDVAKLHSDIPWAEGLGYGVPGRGLDAEHGADLARTDEERLAGPRYDIAIGDHGARLALQSALRHLARAELLLVCANAATGWHRLPALSTTMVLAGELPTTKDLVYSVRVVALLLEVLEEQLPGDRKSRDRVEKWAFKASQHLFRCRGGFSRALERGEVSKPSVPRCRNGICPKMSDPKEGGLCSRCARRLRRSGELPSGKELSAEAGDDGTRDAKKYLNKRAAAGLGHGDESLSHAYRQAGR